MWLYYIVIRSSYGIIGSGASANNNSATVTGPGSVWSNFTLYVAEYSKIVELFFS